MNTIIEKIRAEVERRIKSWSTRGENSPEGQGKDTCVSRVTELTDLLSFLDTLQEQPVCEDVEEEIEKVVEIFNQEPIPEDNIGKKVGDITIFSDISDIARHFYELGRQSKPKVCEGLEEEIDKRWKEWISEDKEQVDGVLPKSEFAFYARHFAQWGAEHLKK